MHLMSKNNFGVWSITIPPLNDGSCAIPHNSKIKVFHIPQFVVLYSDHNLSADIYGYPIWRTH